MMMRSDGKLEHLEFVPEESARDIDDKVDSYEDENGEYDERWKEKIRRKYVVGKVVGPTKPREWDWDKYWKLGAEREAL